MGRPVRPEPHILRQCRRGVAEESPSEREIVCERERDRLARSPGSTLTAHRSANHLPYPPCPWPGFRQPRGLDMAYPPPPQPSSLYTKAPFCGRALSYTPGQMIAKCPWLFCFCLALNLRRPPPPTPRTSPERFLHPPSTRSRHPLVAPDRVRNTTSKTTKEYHFKEYYRRTSKGKKATRKGKAQIFHACTIKKGARFVGSKGQILSKKSRVEYINLGGVTPCIAQ